MTDTKLAAVQPLVSPLYLRDEELKQGVDLLFLAARDLSTASSPPIGAEALGQAHLRALYVISRKPGLSVAELLATLKITKQSLNRVLKELIAAGYVERRPGVRDRRMRHLYPTGKGSRLEALIWEAQRPRLVRAFRDAGPEAVGGFRKVLAALLSHDQVQTRAKR